MAKIDELKFDDKNFNKHSEFGMSLLEKSLGKFGAGRSILIDKHGNIIAGNGIVEAAGNIGLEDVEIVKSDGKKIIAVQRTDIELDSEAGREMALADNATASADLSWDEDLIGEESEKWGFDAGDWLGNEWKNEPEEVVEDEAPEVNEKEPAKSELGKVYRLGEHRLMCGDSTDAGNVAILMDGQKATLVVTDPPYNVNIGQGGGSVMSTRVQNHGADGATILNDNMGDAEFQEFLTKAFKAMASNMTDGGVFYIWHASTEHLNFRIASEKAGLHTKQILVWVKNQLVMGRQDYQWNHELCLYGWKDGTHHWYGGRKDRTTISIVDLFELKRKSKEEILRIIEEESCLNNYDTSTTIYENRPTNSPEHPTMKPIKLLARNIRNSSKKGDCVLDIFGGSGSTLIACEQLGRKCYMVELDPHYCDVIRKRYWKFTHDGDETGWEEGTPEINREEEHDES